MVLGHKINGELGLISLFSMNLALLSKWLCRFKSDASSLWRRVIVGTHNNARKLVYILAKKTSHRVWCNIVKVISTLYEISIELSYVFEFHVGSGNNILLWLDDWLGGGSLASHFPYIFIWKRKSCLISERVNANKFV